MSDRSKKVTELNSTSSASANDLLLIITSPSSANAETKNITVGNFFANSGANTIIKRFTPSSSSDVMPQGTITYDDDFVYVAVANNVIKRVGLNSF